MNKEIFAIFSTMAGLVLPLFISAGHAAKSEIKKKVGSWLANDLKNEEGVRFWAASFIRFFDDFLGNSMFSRKRIIRSTIISYILCFLFLQIEYRNGSHLPTITYVLESNIFVQVAAIFLYNVIGDFISLQESRVVLGLIIKSNAFVVPLLLILDLLLTWFIFWGVLALYFSLFDNINNLGSILTIPKHIEVWPFLATAFVTSIWLYIYAIGAGLIKLRAFIIKGNARIFGLFDVQEKPFTSLAVVSSFYVFVVGLVLSLLF